MRRCAIPLSLALAGAAVLLLAAPAGATGHGHQPVLAIDFFPVDNWIGDGLDKVKDVVFGGISVSAKAIAGLLVNVLAALVNLLIPKSFVNAGLSAVKWLCTVPSFSGQQVGPPGSQLNLPHVDQLRQTLTWIGVCALPLGLVYAGGRSVMTPSAYGDSPQEVLGRVVVAAAWLAFYVWGWQSITHFSGLVSNGVLSLPWVADGIDKLMGGLALTSGALGPISAFAVLLLAFFVGLGLIALLVMKVALLVITAFLFAIGGLIGALYPLPFGRKLVGGYVIAVAAVVALPALWALLFALAAALMVDAHSAGGGGFAAFIAQFWVLGASLATFALALKLGFSAFGFASSTITSFTAGALLGGAGSGGGGHSPSATQTAHRAHSLYNAGGSASARIGGGGGAPGAPGGRTDRVQRTREPAEELRGAVGSSGAAKTAATAGAAAATGGASAGAQAAGAAAKGGSAASAGGASAASQTAAAHGGSKAAGERAPAGRASSARPTAPADAPASVRSTGGAERGEAPRAPAAQPAPPSESARRTPRPASRPTKRPPTPPSSPQSPPRGPRRSDGGKGR